MKEKPHKYKGKIVTAKWLAAKAGCTVSCMNHRLLTKTPEKAVALGASQSIKKYPYKDGMLTSKELAVIAGCKHSVMSSRLHANGGNAEQAIAMGSEDNRGCTKKNIFTWDGKECDYEALAKIRGCTPKTMARRVCAMGLERAMSPEPIPRTKPKKDAQPVNQGDWGDLHDKVRNDNLRYVPKPTRFDLAYGV